MRHSDLLAYDGAGFASLHPLYGAMCPPPHTGFQNRGKPHFRTLRKFTLPLT